MRLWQDLTSCLEMMSLVNHRQELVQHDVAVLRQLRERLHRIETASRPDDVALVLASRLTGLDDELDALLVTKPEPPLAVWVRVIERLCATRGVPGVEVCH